MQLDNQKEIAEMQNETQKEIAGIQSATSRQNTKDQVYAQNEMLAYQQKESTARVASIMENTNLSKQQQASEIMRQMLTQAQTAGQYFTNDQIKEMTRKVSSEDDLVHQQTQNQRYGSAHIGATAKDISSVVSDAASGVVDIFHAIDKAVADTWNNFWKDGKADVFFSSRRRHTRFDCDWSSDVCSSDLTKTSVRFMERHPQALRRYLKALLRADAAIKADMPRAVEILDAGKYYRVDKATLQEIGRASCRERV